MELHIYVKVIHHIYTMFTVYNPLPSYNKLGGCILGKHMEDHQNMLQIGVKVKVESIEKYY